MANSNFHLVVYNSSSRLHGDWSLSSAGFRPPSEPPGYVFSDPGTIRFFYSISSPSCHHVKKDMFASPSAMNNLARSFRQPCGDSFKTRRNMVVWTEHRDLGHVTPLLPIHRPLSVKASSDLTRSWTDRCWCQACTDCRTMSFRRANANQCRLARCSFAFECLEHSLRDEMCRTFRRRRLTQQTMLMFVLSPVGLFEKSSSRGTVDLQPRPKDEDPQSRNFLSQMGLQLKAGLHVTHRP
nr:uncharacterized protein LOC129524277 [Gorilla gorilla gorilla]